MTSAVDGRLLTGKAIVVTGAGRGLGRAYAERIAAHGGNVVVNDVTAEAVRDVGEAIQAAGGQACAVVGSVVDPALAEELVARCTAEFGRIDGLVNNAGIFYEAATAEESPADMRRIVEINLLGTMFCGAAAIRAMLATAAGGSIVNVTSGMHLGVARAGSYCATKGAIASLTYSWALELGESGIRVNALAPFARTPLSRLGTTGDGLATDVAEVVVHLLSDASREVHGQVVRSTGSTISVMRQPALGVRVDGGPWSAEQLSSLFVERLQPDFQDPGLPHAKTNQGVSSA